MGRIGALVLVSVCAGTVAAQETFVQRTSQASLQLGMPLERTLSAGHSHTYQVIAEEKNLVQITVEQRGIDVVVRVHHPQGKKPDEYDSPTGTDGVEDVSFVTGKKGPYTIEVTPLSREPIPAGKYKIELRELRPATEEEIKESKAPEMLKTRGLALLSEIEGVITEVRLPQTRIKAQMQAAVLLWESDEKRALKHVTDAMTDFKQLMANFDQSGREYTSSYYVITTLRFEIVQLLTPHQPEMALSFLRSTPPIPDPYGHQRDLASNEAAMEMQIANQIAERDPKRAFEIARENLKTRYSSALTNTINILRQKNPEMAAQLAGEIASKLLGEDLTKNSQAAALVIGLIQISGSSSGNQVAEPNGSARRTPLLSEQQRRDLLQKAVNEALAFKTQNANMHYPERDYAWGLIHGLHQLGAEVDTVANGSAAAVNKKYGEFVSNNSLSKLQEFHNAINDTNMPIDEVIQVLSKAPAQQREHLFIQLANRVQNSDLARARQIVNDHVTTPYQRRQALYNLELQEINRAMSKGKVEEALRSVANLSNALERANALAQIPQQIGPGYKRAAAMLLLDQARSLLPPSPQAPDYAHMQVLLEIAKAYSRFDAKRPFEIVDPLIDQFNELGAAARTMHGFVGEFYEQEELNLQNGSMLANVATHLTGTLGTIALSNFDRAKLTAERIRLPEVRLRAYLDIAQQAIQNQR